MAHEDTQPTASEALSEEYKEYDRDEERFFELYMLVGNPDEDIHPKNEGETRKRLAEHGASPE